MDSHRATGEKTRSVQTSRRASRGWRRARGGGNLNSFKKQAVSIMIWENEMLFATPQSDLTAFKCTLKRSSQAENVIHTPFSPPTAIPILNSYLHAFSAEAKSLWPHVC